MLAFKKKMLDAGHVLSHLPIEKFSFPPALSKPPCVLVACGSFSPPTFLHLRLMEDAKDRLSQDFHVIGGIISPVHDDYGKTHKESLTAVNASMRIQMCNLATASSKWIGISDWETLEKGWIRTALVLQAYSNALNSKEYLQFINHRNTNSNNSSEQKQNCPESEFTDISKIHIKFLCGSDLLLSFLKPDLWIKEHRTLILNEYGVACMCRDGSELTDEKIAANSIFADNVQNIYRFSPSVENNISSTAVRDLIARKKSIKYLLPDEVIEYILENGVYTGK